MFLGNQKFRCAWESAEVSVALYTVGIMLPNSSGSKVSLKLTANNMFAHYANHFLSNTHEHRLKSWQVCRSFRRAAEKVRTA